jgi:hypothetical protein
LRAGIRHIKVVQRHILDNLLLLVYVALRYWNVFLGLEVELGGIGVRAADALYSSSIGFDVDDVSKPNAFLLYRFVDRRV